MKEKQERFVGQMATGWKNDSTVTLGPDLVGGLAGMAQTWQRRNCSKERETSAQMHRGKNAQPFLPLVL